MDTIRIPLLFSDTTLGTQEFGMIIRTLDGDPDDDDRRYERHLRRTRPDLRIRVVKGIVQVSGG